ncbi:MAG: hypothetical protein M0C28_18485 [Candidatus Moduliflexus flocculans]|nr:hypothetical protein [Candidatus Moduliflexus flocculans]
MIRQPDFVTADVAARAFATVAKRNRANCFERSIFRHRRRRPLRPDHASRAL